MKTRTLVILLIILGLLGGAGVLITSLKGTDRSKGSMGKLLLEKLPANKIVSISIQGADGAVSLGKRDDRWVVEDRFGYPADFSKIIDLVRRLKEMKIGRWFESSEKTLKRLSLKAPDDPDDPDVPEEDKGTWIRLKDNKETLVAGVLIGKTRKTGGERSFPAGQYVRLDQESKIYLVNEEFGFLQKDPSAWLDKNLVEVRANEVKKISCPSADGKNISYAFERPEKEKDLEALNLPANRKINRPTLNRLAGALSSLRMEDVAQPADIAESVGMKRFASLEYHLFSGMIYRIYPGKACLEGDRCYLQLEVDYQKPVPDNKETSEDKPSKKEEKSPEKTPEEQALEAKQQNDRLSPWVFVIPKWQHAAFITDIDQLLEKPDKNNAKESK